MSTLRALTLHQPWASLVALGVKRIETRGWSTKYRGRILIHAAQNKRAMWDAIGLGNGHAALIGALSERLGGGLPGDWENEGRLPLGVVVASAVLADVLPMTTWGDDPRHAHLCIGNDGRLRLWDFIEGSMPWAWRAYDPAMRATSGGPNVDDRTTELPFGDFRPGRFAWLLEDVRPTSERCPRCWGEGLVLDNPLRYSPVKVECRTCEGATACPPVRMRGRQGLWTPRDEDWPVAA